MIGVSFGGFDVFESLQQATGRSKGSDGQAVHAWPCFHVAKDLEEQKMGPH